MGKGRVARRVIASVLLLALVVRIEYVARYQYARRDMGWERVQARGGILLVGMETSSPPFAFYQNDQIVGLEVDIAAEIGRRLGVTAQIVPIGVDGLYDALKISSVDVLISALPFDPTRVGEFWYVRHYLDAGVYIVSREGVYQDMYTLDGQQVAVEYGSMGDEQARRWQRRLKQLEIQHFISTTEAIEAADHGEAPAALVDYVSARLWLKAHPESRLAISEMPVLSETYAPVTRGKEQSIAERVNAAMETMIADGTLAGLIQKWL